jgi:hypothetical protein
VSKPVLEERDESRIIVEVARHSNDLATTLVVERRGCHRAYTVKTRGDVGLVDRRIRPSLDTEQRRDHDFGVIQIDMQGPIVDKRIEKDRGDDIRQEDVGVNGVRPFRSVRKGPQLIA